MRIFYTNSGGGILDRSLSGRITLGLMHECFENMEVINLVRVPFFFLISAADMCACRVGNLRL